MNAETVLNHPKILRIIFLNSLGQANQIALDLEDTIMEIRLT